MSWHWVFKVFFESVLGNYFETDTFHFNKQIYFFSMAMTKKEKEMLSKLELKKKGLQQISSIP